MSVKNDAPDNLGPARKNILFLVWVFGALTLLLCITLYLAFALVFWPRIDMKPRPVPTPKPGDTQVHETFDGRYRWQTWKTTDATVDESNGQLSIEVHKAGIFYTVPFQSMRGGSDYSIAIDGGQIAWLQQGNVDMTFEVTVGSDGGDWAQFGAACRYQNEQNFYSFIVTSNGYYSIYKEVNDKVTNLHPATLSEAVHTGETTNKIHIICSGDQLQFEANDTKLTAVTDTDLKSGIIALLAGAGDSPNTILYFDNLVIRAP